MLPCLPKCYPATVVRQLGEATVPDAPREAEGETLQEGRDWLHARTEARRTDIIDRVMGRTTTEVHARQRCSGARGGSIPSLRYKFVSFKIPVTTSVYDKVLESQLWPEGIRIQDYVRPKRGFSSNEW